MIVHEGHIDSVYPVAFSPDGKSVASGSWDKTIRIWDAYSSSPIGKQLRGHSGGVYSVSYSPLGNVIASGSLDRTIRLWDTNTGRQLGGALEVGDSVLSTAFSPDAKLIASGSAGYYSSSTKWAVQLWDVQKRKAASSPSKGHTDLVWSVSFSHNGARIVSGSDDKTIRIWDVERRTTIIGPLRGHTGWVRSVTFSSDDTQVLSCSFDGTLRLWDACSGKIIGNPYKGHIDWVYSAAFSPCGTYVASGGNDNTVRLWDIRTGRQVDEPFKEHTSHVWSVAFSPCGQYIASGSFDSKVIIRETLGEDSISDGAHGLQKITSQMSTRDMFEWLRRAGCVDLSSRMDSQQEAAIIVSGGGFGNIWNGKMHDGTKVAIKAWRANALEQCDYKKLKRAARELYFWSRMDHPHIHQLLGVILFRDEYLGMVSEWMDNGNLHEYLRKHPDADRYQLVGLEYMHSRHTIHGDIKAINVLVSPDGIARISDFDYSMMLDASNGLVFSVSSGNSRAATTRWAAPELLGLQAQSKTKKSDIYALGMTMLVTHAQTFVFHPLTMNVQEILTGKVPFHNLRDVVVIWTVVGGTPPTRPVELGKNQKGNSMWQLLLDCWSQKPSDRPSSEKVVKTLVNLLAQASPLPNEAEICEGSKGAPT
ncbi:unnamed protein product [Rhizoctonia solani]|uniref:Protein kinase domain-containing protein n=1 Tax=Rhizoctonia solani TaxID=456999 RepID=A0A8H3C4P6_9AGAM|nr:unnamed protein product [Rhizoctonia solani]